MKRGGWLALASIASLLGLAVASRPAKPARDCYDCARVLVIGDSIGAGVGAHWGGARTTAVVGASSGEIPTQVSRDLLEWATIIIVSSGSNDGNTTYGAYRASAFLQEYAPKVYYLSPIMRQKGTGAKLPAAIVFESAFPDSPPSPQDVESKDGVHPADYRELVRRIRAEICGPTCGRWPL